MNFCGERRHLFLSRFWHPWRTRPRPSDGNYSCRRRQPSSAESRVPTDDSRGFDTFKQVKKWSYLDNLVTFLLIALIGN